jgi:uncharacterized RDD family membrane protein YckC
MDDRVSIVTPDHIELDFEPAGLGSRLLAAFLDLLLIVIIFVVILIGSVFAGISVAGLGGGLESSAVLLAALILFFYALIWGYFVVFEALWQGQTPGKRVAGIRVVQDNGLPVGWREAALRNFVRAADMPALWAR